MSDEPTKAILPQGWKNWDTNKIRDVQAQIVEAREPLIVELAAGIEDSGHRIMVKLLNKLYGRLLWRCHVELARRRKIAWRSTKIDLRR